MVIVGQMALHKFPMWDKSLCALSDIVDVLYLRFDGLGGNYDMLPRLSALCGNKLKHVLISYLPWDDSNWREEMIRMLDHVKPDLVLTIDDD